MKDKPKKVIILGSAALKIGEAGEFDFSGSQCLKSLREEGVKTILVNPNIATIQTSEKLADRIYFLPVNPYFVEKIIEKEKPEGILLGFGGQTALNCGIELHKNGVLKKHNVKVLGTPIQAILDTEDRDLFVKKLTEIDLKAPRSIAVNSVEKAKEAAAKIGYPVMIRSAFALGGLGSNICHDEKELSDSAMQAFSHTSQILVEEYLEGWKEVEYEVVRDAYDNCITVCNMENFDPLGIHTGESIVVAPSQTLDNNEYHKLREISIKAIRHIGIVGECNIQFALSPDSDDYKIIEVNARLSRSSALASKATGYPLAFVAAKLALGYSLTELQNSITKSTSSCFEPALDYVVVKIPRWDLKKFRRVSKQIGSSMKSVGEVMAIGRKFEEALQKAIRMLDIGMNGLIQNEIEFDNVEEELKKPTDERIFAIVEALKKNHDVDKIHKLTGIDRWFLYKIMNVIEIESELKKGKTEREILLKAKQHGFSDHQLGLILKSEEDEIIKMRKKYGITPFVRQIDTLAAEYPAKTNYLYLTYNGNGDDIEFKEKNKVIVLGSGVYRIGSSVEFDWCCVNAVFTLNELGYKTIMINYNPETVSTDYDVCDKLYFEEISFETVREIYEKENPEGVIISMGGQIANNIAMQCHNSGIRILGTSALNIDSAEDRYKFSKLLDELKIDQPEWKELTNIKEAIKFANSVSYPVLVRPSYVLSGAAMAAAFNDGALENYLTKASKVNRKHPVVISKFVTEAKEIEIDAVAKDGELMAYAITEHIENAGVHSGDATVVLPAQKLYKETVNRVKEIARKICAELKITGPFNIQFLAKDNLIKVIECNLRASRSFPFVSKVLKRNFIELAVRFIMDKPADSKVTDLIGYVGVKTPQFSYSRLKGADPISYVEMASTGEVACLGEDVNEAFLKSIISTGFKLPRGDVLLSIKGDKNRFRFLESALKLREMNFNIYATEHTSEFLANQGIKNTMVYKVHESKKPNILEMLKERKFDLVMNISFEYGREEFEDEYKMRRLAVDFGIPLITNLQLAGLFVDSLSKKKVEDLKIKAWDEYQ